MNAEQTQRFLYSLELIIEEQDNNKALDKLTTLLNHKDISAYKIVSSKPLQPETPPAEGKLAHMIREFMAKGTLVRLQVVKGFGVKLSMPCRILHFDEEQENLSAYHVDEKQVYLLRLSEIDDIIV